MTRAQWIAQAHEAIGALEAAGKDYEAALIRENNLEAERTEWRTLAVQSLIGTDNPATGKPHSASSAEAAVGASAEYLARGAALAELVARRHLTGTLITAYRLRGELAIACLREPVVVGLA